MPPHPGIETLTPYQPGKSIESLAQASGLSDIIKLASNENPLGCSPHVKVALGAMSPHALASYPSPAHHPLYDKLCDKLGVSKAQLLFANGSDALISLLIITFALHLERSVLTHQYAFSAYPIQAQALGVPVNRVPVEADWSLNIDKLLEACTPKTALIFLATPNNPTGLTIPKADLKKLLSHLPETTLLVLDEAYIDYEPQTIDNTINWLNTYPNLVLLRTFSKVYGLAGLRLGYAIANPDIIAWLARAQLPFTVNQAALTAGSAALDDLEFVEKSLSMTTEGMIQLKEGFKALHLTPHPSEANFITLDLHQEALPIYEKLLQRGIIVRPLAPYGLNNHLRITVGTPTQNTRLLSALANILEEK